MTDVAVANTPEPVRKLRFDFDKIKSSPAFIPGLAIAFVLGLCFWPLFAELPELWTGKDGYYSHGILVPFISAYIIWKSWPEIKDRPVKPAPYMGVVLLMIGWFLYGSVRMMQMQFISGSLVASLLVGIVMIGGWQWLKALALPTAYLLFGLPVMSNVIDTYTNKMQLLSNDVAFMMLKMLGFAPIQDPGSTTINLSRFTLNVAVPCSGLKLMIAVTAFTCFFVMIGRLKWWANVMMFIAVLPLCLFINGLRISLIGMVGNQWGESAGHQFHDYSGYITVVVCFFILFKLARLLGWKD